MSQPGMDFTEDWQELGMTWDEDAGAWTHSIDDRNSRLIAFPCDGEWIVQAGHLKLALRGFFKADRHPMDELQAQALCRTLLRFREALTPHDMNAERCGRCGKPNVQPWVAPSPLWNLIMRGNDINGKPLYGDCVCPSCFLLTAAEQCITGRWRVEVDPLPNDLIYETPSGLRWNDRKWLWESPTPNPRVRR